MRLYCSELLLTVGGCAKGKAMQNILIRWYLRGQGSVFPLMQVSSL